MCRECGNCSKEHPYSTDDAIDKADNINI